MGSGTHISGLKLTTTTQGVLEFGLHSSAVSLGVHEFTNGPVVGLFAAWRNGINQLAFYEDPNYCNRATISIEVPFALPVEVLVRETWNSFPQVLEPLSSGDTWCPTPPVISALDPVPELTLNPDYSLTFLTTDDSLVGQTVTKDFLAEYDDYTAPAGTLTVPFKVEADCELSQIILSDPALPYAVEVEVDTTETFDFQFTHFKEPVWPVDYCTIGVVLSASSADSFLGIQILNIQVNGSVLTLTVTPVDADIGVYQIELVATYSNTVTP